MKPGSYNVTTTASDRYSGIRRIQLLINDEVADEAEQECGSVGGCSLTSSLWFNSSALPEGQHEAKLVATDMVGRSATTSWMINTQPARTAFRLSGPASLDEIAAAAETADSQYLELRHAGATQGGLVVGNEPPASAMAAYRDAYAEDHGSGSSPAITRFTLSGDVPTSTLGALALRVTDRALYATSAIAANAAELVESTLEYADDLLNADLFAESQPFDTREDSTPAADATTRAAADQPPPFKKFAPQYGGIETYTAGGSLPKRIVQTLTFSKAALGQSDLDGDGEVDDDDRSLSPYERSGAPDHGYEHDLKVLDPGYVPPTGRACAPFCKDVRKRFWAQRKSVAWDTNFEDGSDPYLDENFAEDCDRQDFTIGLEFPLNLKGAKKYWIKIRTKAGDKKTSPYVLQAVKTVRVPCGPVPAGNCSGQAGGSVEGQLLVGRSKGRTEECRRWRNGHFSRRTCDHATG